MEKISLIFIGTGDIGIPLLRALTRDERFNIKLVITQADKPAGRKMELKASPIKLIAIDLGIPVFQPDDINSTESLETIRKTHADMIILMAYGQILKKELLEIPEYGCINAHASLLPKHRGASPIQQSLLHQDEETGISIMQMEAKMDSGPVFAQSEIPITDDDNAASLLIKLAEMTAQKTPDVLYEIVTDGLQAAPQDHSIATYCQKIHKNDGHIDWNESAEMIAATVRAFTGWPGTFAFWENRRIKILKAPFYTYEGTEIPGTVFQQGNAVLVKCKRDALLLEVIQMEGKKSQTLGEFIKGYPDFINSKLG